MNPNNNNYIYEDDEERREYQEYLSINSNLVSSTSSLNLLSLPPFRLINNNNNNNANDNHSNRQGNNSNHEEEIEEVDYREYQFLYPRSQRQNQSSRSNSNNNNFLTPVLFANQNEDNDTEMLFSSHHSSEDPLSIAIPNHDVSNDSHYYNTFADRVNPEPPLSFSYTTPVPSNSIQNTPSNNNNNVSETPSSPFIGSTTNWNTERRLEVQTSESFTNDEIDIDIYSLPSTNQPSFDRVYTPEGLSSSPNWDHGILPSNSDSHDQSSINRNTLYNNIQNDDTNNYYTIQNQFRRHHGQYENTTLVATTTTTTNTIQNSVPSSSSTMLSPLDNDNNNDNNNNHHPPNRQDDPTQNVPSIYYPSSSSSSYMIDPILENNNNHSILHRFQWMNQSHMSLLQGYLKQPIPITVMLSSSSTSQSFRYMTNNNYNDDYRNTTMEMSELKEHLPQCTMDSNEKCISMKQIDDPIRKCGGGPSVVLSMLAREYTGKLPGKSIPPYERLKKLSGNHIYNSLDTVSNGMCTEVSNLKEALDKTDWVEVSTIISRITPRLIAFPNSIHHHSATIDNYVSTSTTTNNNSGMDELRNRVRSTSRNDPTLPRSTSLYYAGGGRTGLERDTFVQCGGIPLLLRVFQEPEFVGSDVILQTNDARTLDQDLVKLKLSECWKETLASLRELIFAIPSLVYDDVGSDLLGDGMFLPFLFTLLAHECCFESAASLIEEILSIQSQNFISSASNNTSHDDCVEDIRPIGVQHSSTMTFFLGDIPNLYDLWNRFTCRQLAHFCRILALLVFEPEDRLTLEHSTQFKSIDLLQLRRNRVVRSGKDSTVDQNQAILLNDSTLMMKLVQLLRLLNYAPSLNHRSSYNIMSHFPWLVDTLVMLGLSEIEDWNEIERLEMLAEQLLFRDTHATNTDQRLNDSSHSRLEKPLLNDKYQEFRVESRMQRSDVGSISSMFENLSDLMLPDAANLSIGVAQFGHIISVINAAQQAGVIVGRSRSNQNLADQVGSPISEEDLNGRRGRSRRVDRPRFNHNQADQIGLPISEEDLNGRRMRSRRIFQPEDAANELQFNALNLSPFQVEISFVVCTLLGGKRKIDAQDTFIKLGLPEVLDDMFYRLSWAETSSSTGQRISNNQNHEVLGENDEEGIGIHGPGCDCNHENTLRIQYLRLVHNLCDRDYDNYMGRRFLLSESERNYIFSESTASDSKLTRGLMTKICAAYRLEPENSVYRFWLASCIEAWLRGSSCKEQSFCANSGLLSYLVEYIISGNCFCDGSLQTSFDLLGELCKGNTETLNLLLHNLRGGRFVKLMIVAISNLVDSNVFIRYLLVSIERVLAVDMIERNSPSAAAGYLTHSWWDVPSYSSFKIKSDSFFLMKECGIGQSHTAYKASEWFHPFQQLSEGECEIYLKEKSNNSLERSHLSGENLEIFNHVVTFFIDNQALLMRDLLNELYLRNINHENICCLNTAIIISIFAHRRGHLAQVVSSLREYSERLPESNNISMCYKFDDDKDVTVSSSAKKECCDDILKNFRELLWFWSEYYTHRGRDRLSLEFSSHLQWTEWKNVVDILCADKNTATSLTPSRIRLPVSPYQRSVRF